MSALAIVVIALALVLAILFVGGLLASRRRDAWREGDRLRRVAEADHALEQARAADKGWDRRRLEEAARQALARARPGWDYERLDLVLVDDRPGVEDDRAHFLATGAGEEARVVLTRHDERWTPDRVE